MPPRRSRTSLSADGPDNKRPRVESNDSVQSDPAALVSSSSSTHSHLSVQDSSPQDGFTGSTPAQTASTVSAVPGVLVLTAAPATRSVLSHGDSDRVPTSTKSSDTIRPSTPSAWSVTTMSSPAVEPSTDLVTSGQREPSELEYADSPPAKVHPSFEGVDYVPFDVLSRLKDFAIKTDPDNSRFSLGTLPADVRWGTSYKTERVLCDRNNKPLTIWLLIKVKSKWFYDRDGNPHSRVNMSGELPYQGDYHALCQLYERFSCTDEPPSPVVYANRFQTRVVKGLDRPAIDPFDGLYDARNKFRAKKDMASIESSIIGPGDIGLLEVSYTRWKATKEAKSARGWSSWEVSFDLQSFSMLYEAPPGTAIDGPAVVPDYDDNM